MVCLNKYFTEFKLYVILDANKNKGCAFMITTVFSVSRHNF